MYRKLFLLIIIALLGLVGQTAIAAPDDTSGYLSNGGFEGGFHNEGDDRIADGWSRVDLSGNGRWQSTQEFAGPDGWVEKIEGNNSQILSVENLGVGNPFETVLYHQVSGLTVGQSYSFSGWVLKMYGGSANTNYPSGAELGSWLGVDPTGGTNPAAASVQWTGAHYQTERPRWRNQRLAFLASSATITVFVKVRLAVQRAETQIIADAMELFDAPTVDLRTPSGTITTPRLDFSGNLPQMLIDRGSYDLYYKIEKQVSATNWQTLIEDIQTDEVDIPLEWGQTVTLRVQPYAKQDDVPNWPPTTHIGLPSAPITVTYGEVVYYDSYTYAPLVMR